MPNVSNINGAPLSSVSSIAGVAKGSLSAFNGVALETTYDLNVFLVGGQSNSSGRSLYTDPDTPVYLQDGIVDDVSAYSGQNAIYSLNAVATTGRDSLGVGKFSFNHVTMHLATQQINDVVSVQQTIGGTILYAQAYANGCWNADYDAIPSGTPRLLQELEIKYKLFANWATSKGLTFKVRGLLWHQGESDGLAGGLASSTYGANWAALVSKVRSFTGDAALPIFYGTIPATSADYDVVIRDAMLDYAASDPNAYCRDNDDLTMFDGVHFDAASNVVFGTWAYETWLAQI